MMDNVYFSDDDDFASDDDDSGSCDDGAFSVVNQVFPISGNKIRSLLLDDEGLRFSGRRFKFSEEFEEAWGKKWTTATKLEVKHRSIRSITKEDGELKIRIAYKTWIGIPGECEFEFFDARVCAAFLVYMEKEQYFTYTHERLLPFRAVSRYILGLLFTIAMTWLCLYLVADQSHGATDEDGDAKARLFLYLIGLLGVRGILAIGIGICGYVVFKIWRRLRRPPYVVRLVRG